MQIFSNPLFIYLIFVIQGDCHYERHNQFCGGVNGSDIKWSLVVKENKTYFFQIVEVKNEYLSKPKTTFLTGTWGSIGDTLKLSGATEKGDILFFYKDKNKLIFQSDRSRIRSRSLVYLDYLERPDNF